MIHTEILLDVVWATLKAVFDICAVHDPSRRTTANDICHMLSGNSWPTHVAGHPRVPGNKEEQSENNIIWLLILPHSPHANIQLFCDTIGTKNNDSESVRTTVWLAHHQTFPFAMYIYQTVVETASQVLLSDSRTAIHNEMTDVQVCSVYFCSSVCAGYCDRHVVLYAVFVAYVYYCKYLAKSLK